MSRHTLVPRPDLSRPVEVTCGWDGPLQTFFLQVEALDAPPDTDAVLLWIGGDWREQTRVEGILTAAEAWALVPPDLVDRLMADCAGDQRTAAPPLLTALNVLRRR